MAGFKDKSEGEPTAAPATELARRAAGLSYREALERAAKVASVNAALERAAKVGATNAALEQAAKVASVNAVLERAAKVVSANAALGRSIDAESLAGTPEFHVQRVLPQKASLTATQIAPEKVISTPADLGSLVRRTRERRQLNQQAFADLAGVGRRFLSELENGKPTLELGKVLQVLAAAGIDLTARERS